LRPLPPAFAWERFATEERRVSWDGFLSYEGVLYGLPAAAAAQYDALYGVEVFA